MTVNMSSCQMYNRYDVTRRMTLNSHTFKIHECLSEIVNILIKTTWRIYIVSREVSLAKYYHIIFYTG